MIFTVNEGKIGWMVLDVDSVHEGGSKLSFQFDAPHPPSEEVIAALSSLHMLKSVCQYFKAPHGPNRASAAKTVHTLLTGGVVKKKVGAKNVESELPALIAECHERGILKVPNLKKPGTERAVNKAAIADLKAAIEEANAAESEDEEVEDQEEEGAEEEEQDDPDEVGYLAHL